MQRCLTPTKPEKKSVETDWQLGQDWRQAAGRTGLAAAYQIFEYEVEAKG